MFKKLSKFKKEQSENIDLFLAIPEVKEVAIVSSIASIICGFMGLYSGYYTKLVGEMHPFLMFGAVLIFMFWAVVWIHYQKKREKKG